jgi:hypothetical protein
VLAGNHAALMILWGRRVDVGWRRSVVGLHRLGVGWCRVVVGWRCLILTGTNLYWLNAELAPDLAILHSKSKSASIPIAGCITIGPDSSVSLLVGVT